MQHDQRSIVVGSALCRHFYFRSIHVAFDVFQSGLIKHQRLHSRGARDTLFSRPTTQPAWYLWIRLFESSTN